jgi:hypothetical protein
MPVQVVEATMSDMAVSEEDGTERGSGAAFVGSTAGPS